MQSTQNTSAIAWYRTPLSADVLAELNRKSDLRGLCQGGGHLALFLLTGSTAIAAFYASNWPLMLAALFLHGTVTAFFANACHELVHGTVFNNRRLNDFFLYVFAFFRWFPSEFYWQYHITHHQFTLNRPQDADPELFPYADNPGKLRQISLREFVSREFINPFNLLGPLRRSFNLARGRFSGPAEEALFSSPDSRRLVVYWARCLLLGHGLITVVSIYFGAWIIPVVTTLNPCYGSWLQTLCNHPQHAGLPTNTRDFRLSCRSNYLNPLLEFLYWHMNYHLEHHMYAAVPCYRLEKLHQAIRFDLPPTLSGLLPVWRQIIAIQERQKTEPDYAYVPELPGVANTATDPNPNADSGGQAGPLAGRQESAGSPAAEVSGRVWQCMICGFVYSERLGLPDEGIPAGTAWEDVPEDWLCPECGTSKADFDMQGRV